LEVNPFFTQTEFRNLQFETIINRAEEYAEDRRINFAGLAAKAVFDDTIERGYNLLQGTRGSFEFIHRQAIGESSESFSNLRFDFRHYQPIHREITLASRVFYGQFFGRNTPQYMIGGVPNWFLNRTKNHLERNPLQIGNTIENSDLLFSEFVTNLRGFPYNEVFGNSTFLFNTELRFPVFDYFSKAPVSSTFLRNFILIGFFDLGTAWDGPPPLTRENSSNKVLYRPEQSVFSAEISNFMNPWMMSYGFGMRTVLLGYYAKIDYAKPIRDFEVQRGRINVSVGLDF
jgi:outer membrane protein assembly factor BamA